MNKTIYTYYEPIDRINNCKQRNYHQEDLIDICARSWAKNGWTLVVLNHSFAERHPFYTEYSSTIKQLPSVNPQPYDYHCYMRWLAMTQIGGGIMIDYDVINYNLQDSSVLYKDKMTGFQLHVPSVVCGSADQFLQSCKRFCQLKDNPNCIHKINNKPHTSDMIMIGSGFSSQDFERLNYVTDYPNVSGLVHCSQRFCVTNKKTKIEAMTDLLEEIMK